LEKTIVNIFSESIKVYTKFLTASFYSVVMSFINKKDITVSISQLLYITILLLCINYIYVMFKAGVNMEIKKALDVKQNVSFQKLFLVTIFHGLLSTNKDVYKESILALEENFNDLFLLKKENNFFFVRNRSVDPFVMVNKQQFRVFKKELNSLNKSFVEIFINKKAITILCYHNNQLQYRIPFK
jgi:hypothetical protein